MASLQELKQPKQEVVRLECENKLQQQTTGEVLDSAARGAGTSIRYVKRMYEAPELQCVVLATNITRRFLVWCGEGVSELKPYSCGEYLGVGKIVRIGVQLIRLAERIKRCGYDSSDDSGKTWEVLFAIAQYGGCYTGKYIVERDGDWELEFCVPGLVEKVAGCP